MVSILNSVGSIVSVVTTVAVGMTLMQIMKLVTDQLSEEITSVKYPPDRINEILNMEDKTFDFIILGGGTAGSVLASRLTENPDMKVLVVEAGNDPLAISEIPGATFVMQDTYQNWEYQAEVENGSCLSMRDQMCEADKGKVLGGTSVMNAMYYLPGNEEDYDNWAAAGNEGWSYKEIKEYFKKSQQMQPSYIAEHGTDDFGEHGLWPLRNANSTFLWLQDIILEGWASLGHKILDGFTPTNQIGFGRNHQSMDRGRRMNTAKAFLAPFASRENLFVMKGTLAEKLIMDGTTAKGAIVSVPTGEKVEVFASKEVILSTGGIATPQILMLSGIGPRKHLEEMGIEVIADLAVGQNLQDHLVWLASYFTYKNESRPPAIVHLGTAVSDYVTKQEGYLASLTSIDLVGFVNLPDSTRQGPDLEFIFCAIPSFDKVSANSVSDGTHVSDELRQELMTSVEVNDTLIIGIVLSHPGSRGTITLRSLDPTEQPIIHNNYFSDPQDIGTTIKGIDYVKALSSSDAVRRHGMEMIIVRIKDCEVHEFESDDFWECSVRHLVTTFWHHCGTAKMGPKTDPTSVVDSTLRVHGISGLRVIDTSIFPTLIAGHTAGPVIMVAEKGADMVKQAWS